MTVAELTACGKPAILIPLPSAIYDHQTQNAKVMEAAGAAVVLPQSVLTGASVGLAQWQAFLETLSDCGRWARPVYLCGESMQPR